MTRRLTIAAALAFAAFWQAVQTCGMTPSPTGPTVDHVGRLERNKNKTTPLFQQRGLTTCSVKENEMAEMNVAEVEYRDVPGLPGYRVGNDGSLWSCHRTNAGMTSDWRQVRGCRYGTRKQYVCLRVLMDGKAQFYPVHHLVLEAFVGPRPDGMQCCHRNDIGDDNRLGNLRWDTPKANCEDRTNNGKSSTGERNWSARLTASDVIAIRELAAAGMALRNIARRFPVGENNISEIVRGSTWRHVGGPIRTERLNNRKRTPDGKYSTEAA